MGVHWCVLVWMWEGKRDEMGAGGCSGPEEKGEMGMEEEYWRRE